MADSVSIHFDTARFNARLAQFLAVTTREAEKVVFEVAALVLGDTVSGCINIKTGRAEQGLMVAQSFSCYYTSGRQGQCLTQYASPLL